MIDEGELRASYVNGLSTLRSQRELTGPADGMYWLMPFAVAIERAGGEYNPSLAWPDYEDLSDRERKAVEMIRASLSTSRKDLIDYAGFGSALYQFVYALFSINEKWKKEPASTTAEVPSAATRNECSPCHLRLAHLLRRGIGQSYQSIWTGRRRKPGRPGSG
jgi:hypothetical protein